MLRTILLVAGALIVGAALAVGGLFALGIITLGAAKEETKHPPLQRHRPKQTSPQRLPKPAKPYRI